MCMGLWSIRVCILLWLTSGSCINGVRDEVFWFLHMSDLHLSEPSPSREAELHRLLRGVLSDFQFSSILVTGDLVEGKNNPWRAAQSQKEWDGYQSIISTVRSELHISNDTFIDIRGNHDMFDVPIRNGDRDFYKKFGSQGQNWSTGSVLVHPIFGMGQCPVYVFIGVDVSPGVGLRSPLNFFGRVTDDIIKELESVIVDTMRKWYGHGCDPVFMAYGHYTLSTIAKGAYFIATEQNGLVNVLLKYGIDAWLCGHLHSEIGEHLHRLHRGHASTSLELETMDWKDKRRFRIMAIDDKHISFVNIQLKDRSLTIPSIESLDSETVINGAVVLMTSPPSPYYSPLGNRRLVDSSTDVRALVWPIQTKQNDLLVSAEFYCNLEVQQVIQLTPVDGGPLYQTANLKTINDTLCQGEELHVRVKVKIQGTNMVSFSERRLIQSRTAAVEYPHSWKEVVALKFPWYNVLQNLSISFLLAHIVFILIVPKVFYFLRKPRLDQPSLDDGVNDKQDDRHRCLSILMAPLHGMALATQYPFFFWGQLCFMLMLMFGPWFFARVLSNTPLGMIFLSTVYARPTGHLYSIFAPEMTLRACFYYVFVILPTTLWMIWTLNRYAGKRNGSCKRHKLISFFYILMGIFCFACFVHSVRGTWLYYGPLAFFLSPSLLGWLLLNILTLIAATRFSGPKCRQE